MTAEELQLKGIEYRQKLLKYIKMAKAGHTGGSLSCVDIISVLYNNVLNVSPENFGDPDRDRYVQSKGHSVEALFVVLADQGFYDESEIETLCQYQSHFVGHPTRKVPGVEMNTGGLGHGLSISVGMAIAGKKDNKDYRVFTLLGDGELAEGSNWEAAMTASHYQLDNLVAIIDRNKLQITASTDKVMDTEPLVQKWEAFGWKTIEVDGHDYDKLTEVIGGAPHEKGKPTMVVANTTKGKGISFMEDVLKWHHGVPSDEEYEQAMDELATKKEALHAVG